MLEARKGKDLTQKVLARLAGISRAFYTNVENSIYNPSWDVVQRICDILEESADIFRVYDVRLENKRIYKCSFY